MSCLVLATCSSGTNHRLTFSSGALTIPATLRSPGVRARATSSTIPSSVAAVHKDAQVDTVNLRNRIDLHPRYSAVTTAFTDAKPLHNVEVFDAPCILSENETSCGDGPVEFERAVVARTVTKLLSADNLVAVG